MTTALGYLYYFFDKMIQFVFNTMEIDTNVTVGWILISVALFGLIIKSVLNIPRNVKINFKKGKTK